MSQSLQCVCTISVPLVQYGTGSTADTIFKVILLVIEIEWVSDKIIILFSDNM